MKFFEICAEVLVPKFTRAEVRLPGWKSGTLSMKQALKTLLWTIIIVKVQPIEYHRIDRFHKITVSPLFQQVTIVIWSGIHASVGIHAPVGSSWCDIFGFDWCWRGAVRVSEDFVVLVRYSARFWQISWWTAPNYAVLAPTGSGAWIPGYDINDIPDH